MSEWADWEKISRLFQLHPKALDWFRFTRFSDAALAKSEDGSRQRRCINSTMPVLYRGLNLFRLAGISPFFMMDMPIGIVLSLLTHQFKQPCAVGRQELHFSYVLPAHNNIGINVRTWLAMRPVSAILTIAYELSATTPMSRAAAFRMSGKNRAFGYRQLSG